MDCIEARAKIYSLFTFNFTPKNVEETRKYLQKHLLGCPECRGYLNEMFAQKKEVEK